MKNQIKEAKIKLSIGHLQKKNHLMDHSSSGNPSGLASVEIVEPKSPDEKMCSPINIDLKINS
jgi:hypothetical protein